MLESGISSFEKIEIDIQGIQYGSSSGSLELQVMARENLQNLQRTKKLQEIAREAKSIRNENSKGNK